ncbi:MAG: cupin domain-containing protein [Pseudomonadota bacterium]|nr:cupin domain-containing protein [Pseudomonadota bacterium]
MPKVDLAPIAETNRTWYPAPFDQQVAGRWYRRLAPAVGLTDFGASLVRLEPGAWSSQRHWHEGEDELLVMIEGEAVLVEDGGRTVLRAGDLAAWPKDVANGHHLINDSDTPCRFLVVGRHSGQDCHYPDIDLLADGATDTYLHKGGTPY